MAKYTVTYTFESGVKARGPEVLYEFEAIETWAAAMPDPAEAWSGAPNYVEADGTADALTITMPNTWTTFVGKGGSVLLVKIKSNNTGAATATIDSLTAVDIKDPDGNALGAAELVANRFVWMVYDETNGYLRAMV